MAVLTKSEYYVYESDLNLTEIQKEKINSLLLSVGHTDFDFFVDNNIVHSQCFSCEEEAYQMNNKIDAIVAEDD
jgi:hypothetical protein